MEHHTIVIGGGLAGMTAAAELARAGRAVTLLEATDHLGGRARSRRRDGFSFNLGPHAVFLAGEGAPILRRLGVAVRGRRPRGRRAAFLLDGETIPMARYVRSEVRQRCTTLREALGAGSRRAAALSGTAVSAWLDETLHDPAGRAVVASLLRTANYAADFDLVDAGAATRQLRLAARGVRYVDGGWQSMVDGFAAVLGSAGVDVRLGVPVAAVAHGERVHAVVLRDGRELPASGVVVAVNDARRAAALLDGPGAAPVQAAASATVPVRMAHLDVALRPLPERRRANVFGLDQPVLLSLVSDAADVAPADAAVVSVGRYLRPGEERSDHRAGLEAVLEAAQPGWADHAVDVRYTPSSLVAGDHARVATRGLGGRADVAVAGVAGLAVAGDWIGPRGALADAAIRSGHDAARLLLSTAADPGGDTRGPLPGHRLAEAS